MKQLAIAALAACCVGFAQAVTLDWEWNVSDTSASINKDGVAFSVAIAFESDFDDLAANGNKAILDFTGNGGGQLQFVAFDGGEGGMGLRGPDNKWTASTHSNAFATGRHTVVLNFVPTEGREGNFDIIFYLDGKNAYGNIHDVPLGDAITMTISASSDADRAANVGWTIEGIGIFDGTLTQAQIDAFAESHEIRSIPEPTALALLALGVAGLALRRRAA